MYELIDNMDEITQGDILKGCPVPILKNFTGYEEGKVITAEIETFDGIIMTQACDIANNKVDNDIISFIQWSISDLHIVFAISFNVCSFNEKDSGLYVKAFPFHSFTFKNL